MCKRKLDGFDPDQIEEIKRNMVWPHFEEGNTLLYALKQQLDEFYGSVGQAFATLNIPGTTDIDAEYFDFIMKRYLLIPKLKKSMYK